MKEPADDPSFETVVIEILRGVLELLRKWDNHKPAYQLDDGHYERQARVSELTELFAELEDRPRGERAL